MSDVAQKEEESQPPTNDSSSLEFVPGQLDWDGPDDPDNPHNWPVWKRIFHSAIPAIYSFGLATGISTFVAAVPYVMIEYDLNRTVALLPVTLYTVGFIIGPLICSPFSELFGRRMIYWTNFPMLVGFNAIAAGSNKFPVLVVFRCLAGIGGSGVLAVGGGTIADLWEPKDAGRVGLSYILAPFLGPTLGPLIGAYTVAQYDNNWKYSIWVVLMILAPIGVAIIFMEETSKSRILYLRAQRRGLYVEKDRPSVVLRKIGQVMMKPLYMCVFEPLAFWLSLYTAYSFAMIFSFFGSYAYVYSTVYHFNQKEIGLCYIAVVVGFMFAVVTFGYFDKTKYQPEALRTNHKVAPEFRLYSALVGCWLVPIGLFWYAWTPRESVHWIVPVLAGIPFGWGTLASFVSCMSYIVDTYLTTNAASAIAANGVIRFTLCAAFPLFIIQVYENLGIHWAGTLFAFISIAMIPVPWLFFLKGKTLRKRSHYETCAY